MEAKIRSLGVNSSQRHEQSRRRGRGERSEKRGMELPKFWGDFRSTNLQNPQNSKSSSAGNSFDNDKNYVERDKSERGRTQQINSFSYVGEVYGSKIIY